MTNPSPTLPPVPSTIANLPAANTITGSEFVAISQNGVTVRATTQQIILPGGPISSVTGGNGISTSSTGGAVTVSLAALPSGDILVGSASNVATAVSVSGDATLANNGALTLGTVNGNVGSFTYSSITVNAKGQVTAASSGTPPAAAIVYGAISGCLISAITGSSTTATLSVAIGQATNSINTAYITSAGYSWAVSNGNVINGSDASGSTLANSTTYHVFLCSGGTGTGTFVSASLTPTFPTGYTTSSRRVGSFTTDVAGNPNPYNSISVMGGGTLNYLVTMSEDVNNSITTTASILRIGSVPSGVRMQAIGRIYMSATNLMISSPDETDVAPSASASPLSDVNSSTPISAGYYTTNTSGQLRFRGTGSGTAQWVTRGWIDFRVS